MDRIFVAPHSLYSAATAAASADAARMPLAQLTAHAQGRAPLGSGHLFSR